MFGSMWASGSILKTLALLGLLLSFGPPVKAQYPQDAATAGASDTTVEVGDRVIVGGEGWKPGSTVELRLPSTNVGQARVNRQGEFSTRVTIPDGVPSGEQLIKVSGTSVASEPSEIGIRMIVAGTSVLTDEDDVSFTGASIGMWIMLAVGLFLVGILAALQVRRRTSPQR